MYKQRQVIYFKGTEEAKIGELLISGNGTMFIANCDPINARPIYIYVLSNEIIKADDWYFHRNEIHKCNIGVPLGVNPKVIATNDPKLNKGWIRDDDPQREFPERVMITTMSGVPKLSNSFIERFIYRYNIKHPMIDIMVKYKECETHNADACNVRFSCCNEPCKLIINSDNVINTKEEKYNFTRSEVIELLRSLDDGSGYFTSTVIDNFINENLSEQL